jgi:hypothetical protein
LLANFEKQGGIYLIVLAIAKAIVIAIARNPLVKCRGFIKIIKGVCQRNEGKAERVNPSLSHPPEDGFNQTNFHSRAPVVLKRVPGQSPLITIAFCQMGSI